MRRDVRIRASLKFVESINKLYPEKESMRIKTEKLNKILEDLIYGTKKK